MKQTGYDMLRLAAFAVGGRKPEDAAIAAMDLGRLYQMCEFHSLTALVGHALEQAGVTLPAQWKEACGKAVRKTLLFDAERARICAFLDAHQIWYMPLKGILLKDLYPGIGLRQMADNDILYDPAAQKQVYAFMLDSGYRAESYRQNHHDEYTKPPVYHFEMHTLLFNRASEFYDYYVNVKERLRKDADNACGWHFSDEDLYLYFTAHEYKHFSDGGTGLRSLLDCFLYTRAKQLDWEYLEQELKKLGLSEFEEKTRMLAEKVFTDPDAALSPQEQQLLDYYLFSGTYGSVEQSVQNKIRKAGGTRAAYLWRRIFPDMKTYEAYYPFFYRHKWLLPVAWVYRLLRGVTVRHRIISMELRTLLHRKRSSPETNDLPE